MQNRLQCEWRNVDVRESVSYGNWRACNTALNLTPFLFWSSMKYQGYNLSASYIMSVYDPHRLLVYEQGLVFFYMSIIRDRDRAPSKWD